MKKAEKNTVESESYTKQLIELKKMVASLEHFIGQKQILLDFKDNMIDIVEDFQNVKHLNISTRENIGFVISFLFSPFQNRPGKH